MLRRSSLIFCLLFFIPLLSSCATTEAPQQIITAYATQSAQYWFADLYACAENQAVAINLNAEKPDLYLRLGEPENSIQPAYKIGDEEILVVVNHDSALQNLSATQTRELFLRGTAPAQIWVFSPGEDLQRAFERLVLRGSRVTSAAKAALSLGQMSAALNADVAAVGILPKRALTGNLRAIYSAGVVPVLAFTQAQPNSAVGGLIACLQK